MHPSNDEERAKMFGLRREPKMAIDPGEPTSHSPN